MEQYIENKLFYLGQDLRKKQIKEIQIFFLGNWYRKIIPIKYGEEENIKEEYTKKYTIKVPFNEKEINYIIKNNLENHIFGEFYYR